jgi:hypothetical protein
MTSGYHHENLRSSLIVEGLRERVRVLVRTPF